MTLIILISSAPGTRIQSVCSFQVQRVHEWPLESQLHNQIYICMPPPRCYPPVIDKIVDNTHKNISVTWKHLSSVTRTMEVYGTFWFVSPLCMITNLCLQIKNQCKEKVFRGNLLRWSFPGLKYQTYLSLLNINKNIFDVFSSSTSGWQGLLSFRIF